MGFFQWLFGGSNNSEQKRIEPGVESSAENQPSKKFHIQIPPRRSGFCVCGCKGKKWTYERRLFINESRYWDCPARLARKHNEYRSTLVKEQKKLDQWSLRDSKNEPAKSKDEAEARQLKTFLGKRCRTCKTNIRNLRYECVACRKEEDKRRDAMKRGAYPEDLTASEKRQILEIYDKCRSISESSGVPHHVDHIKPLAKGGRHHPDNLQIITAEENLKKGAKWDEP